MVNNRRHSSLSIWLACQTYKSIPLQVRMGLTSLFVFKINKQEMANIFQEQVEINDEAFKEIISIAYKKSHDFIFIDSNTQRIFLNWDEIIIE